MFAFNMEQFNKQFGSVVDCCRYLFQAKWPNGFECPRCGCRYAYSISSSRLPLFECKSCHKQTPLLAGTVMEGSRTCLRKWFLAFHLILSGTTACDLSRAIGVTYKTAWLILNKIRQAISCSLKSVKLYGTVLAQSEVYGRSPYYSWVFRHPKERPVFIGTTMRPDGTPSYIKIGVIPEYHIRGRMVLPSAAASFADHHVHPNEAEAGYITPLYDKRRSYALKLIFRTAKSWICHNYLGVGRSYLQSYFDEFCYRFNHSIKPQSLFTNLPDLFLISTPTCA